MSKEKKKEEKTDSPALQHTPAAVRVLHGHAGVTVCLQVTRLDRHLGDLSRTQTQTRCDQGGAVWNGFSSFMAVRFLINSLTSFIYLKIRDEIELYSSRRKFLCQRLLKNTNNIRIKTTE